MSRRAVSALNLNPRKHIFYPNEPIAVHLAKCCVSMLKIDQLNPHNENPQYTDHLFGSDACNIQGASYLRRLLRASRPAGILSECLALDRAGIAS